MGDHGHIALQQLSDAAIGNAQFIMSDKLQSTLLMYIPSVRERLIMLLAATALLLAWGSTHPRSQASFSNGVWRGVILTVLAGTCMELVTADETHEYPVILVQLCIVLIAMDALLSHAEKYTHGVLQRILRSNLTYTFGLTVSRYLRSGTSTGVACVAAVLMIGASNAQSSGVRCIRRSEALLVEGVGVAGLDVIRVVTLKALPDTLRLPTLLALICFISPVQRATCEQCNLFTFVLYASAASTSEALASMFTLYQATALSVIVTAGAPFETMRNVGTMVTMNLGTELFSWLMKDALRDDAAVSLVSVTIIAVALTQAVFHPSH